MKKRIMGVALAAATIGVLATGCQQKPEGAIATVGDQVVTEDDLNKYMGELKKYYGEEMFNESTQQGKNMVAEAKENVTEALINQKVMDKIMADNKITVEDKEVDETIKAMKEQIGGEEEFKKVLEAQGATEEQLRGQYLEQLKSNKYNQFVAEKFKPSEEDIKKYYNENKDDYIQYNASHILITPEEQTEVKEGEEPKPADPEAAAKKAEELAAKVAKDAKKEGVDFARLAKQHSKDPGSAQNGGSLGNFLPFSMVEEFKNALKGMKAGEISEPVKSQYGYHVIKVNAVEEDFDKYEEETKAQANQDIITKIVQKKSEDLINQYRRDLGVKKYK
ncbi:MAG: peptidylprolyl isomerase [Gallicola sp.]|nr:peptidylprolyl isomerase [Gallicola sp.]